MLAMSHIRWATSMTYKLASEVSGSFSASDIPGHFSVMIYSHPTGLYGDGSQASTSGIGAPSFVLRKSIVATSLLVRSPRGPALRKGMRAIRSRRSSNLRLKIRLYDPKIFQNGSLLKVLFSPTFMGRSNVRAGSARYSRGNILQGFNVEVKLPNFGL